MTTNPRAMDIATTVLRSLTPEIRTNVRDMGREALDKLNTLKTELGGLITKVQGTGLLFSCELDPAFKCYGAGSTEEFMRERGIGVIHGGTNSLRFTPHFGITSGELDLIIENIRFALLNGPRRKEAAAA
jgi:acetylornithine/succinyldiaminopimelate/putrescine aminotransferase